MITIRRIEPVSGMRVVFNKPLMIEEKRDGKLWFGEIEEIKLCALGGTKAELGFSFVEQLESDYIFFFFVPDDKLIEKGQEMKQWFLANTHVEEVEL